MNISTRFSTGTIIHTVLRKRYCFRRQSNRRWTSSTSPSISLSESGRKKLVILGTGWGSYSVLRSIDKSLYDVVVVSPRNYFLFTPLLCSTTVGTLEFRSIIEPLRRTKFRQTDHYLQAYAEDIDFMKQEVKVKSWLDSRLAYDVSYDKLVIGVGALSNTFNIPGVDKYAFFLKEVGDARRIRDRLLHNIELSTQPGVGQEEISRLLHFVIVGGGPTGIEFGAEIYDFVEQDVSQMYTKFKDEVRVTLIESNQILSSFDEKLRNFAEKKIKMRKGFTLERDAVTEVHSDRVELKNGSIIPCGMVVWSTGLAPRELVQKLDVKKNIRKQILTDDYLRVLGEGSGNVYAIGDCADIEKNSLPCTAQVAERQGRYLSREFGSKATGEPFQFKSGGMLAYIGKYEGVSDLPDVKFQGVPSWFLWRLAYLTKLGSWRLRMQVPLDWLKTLLFGRDISRF